MHFQRNKNIVRGTLGVSFLRGACSSIRIVHGLQYPDAVITSGQLSQSLQCCCVPTRPNGLSRKLPRRLVYPHWSLLSKHVSAAQVHHRRFCLLTFL